MIPLGTVIFFFFQYTEWDECWYFSAKYYGFFSFIVKIGILKKSHYKTQQTVHFLHPFSFWEMSDEPDSLVII